MRLPLPAARMMEAILSFLFIMGEKIGDHIGCVKGKRFILDRNPVISYITPSLKQ
jgi:hypothetical protein